MLTILIVAYSAIIFLKIKISSIDRASLAEKSARKDEKTLFWPPPIFGYQIKGKQKSAEIANNQTTFDGIHIVIQQVYKLINPSLLKYHLTIIEYGQTGR